MTMMSEEQWDEYIDELAELYVPTYDDPQEF
jgi:hypothetical protein